MATTYDIDIKLNVDDSELENASAGLQELEANAENATGSADELSDSLDNVGSGGLDDAADGASQVESNSDGASISISNLGDNLGLINAGALLGIAEEIGRIGDSAEAMSQEMNTAAISVGQLATNVGMAEPQMVGLINNISNATFPQEEALAYVDALNQMGVTADQLGASATNMDRINDATGMGYQSVMQLTQGLQAVGVEANNLPSSFNAIAYAEANVNGGANTLGMVLKRQAATINEYGLNVDQLVLIMQKFSERGVQGMKMGSELSSVLKETNGDTAALEKTLGLTAGSLTKAGEVTGEYEGQLQKLADEEADHKTLLDQVGAVWEDLSLTLGPILAPLGSLAGILGGIGQAGLAVAGLSSLAETLGLTGIAAEGASAGFFTLGAAELTALWPILAIVGAVALLAVGFEQLGEYMGWWTDFGSMFDSLRAGVMRLWNAFMNSRLVTMTIDALKGAFEALKNFVQPLWDELFNGAGEGGGGFDIVGLWIENFTMLEDVILTVIGVFQGFGNMVVSILTMILSPIQLLYTTWVSVFEGQTSIFDAIMMSLQILVSSYQNILNMLGTVISTILQAILGRISSWATGLVNRARSAVSQFVSGVINGLTSLPSRFSSALQGVITAVSNWGTGLLNKANEIINQFKQTIENGVTQAKSWVGLGVSYEGTNYSGVGYSGFNTGNTLNRTISTSSASNNSSNTVNLNLSGIIDKDASTYIVDAVNDHIKKNNLIRGV